LVIKMRIALDWDGSYTLDPEFWDSFILLCKNGGHDVRIITLRKPEMHIDMKFFDYEIPIIYTSNMHKREYCDKIDWHPDIWIDDSPEFIVRQDVFKFLDVMKGEERREQTEGE